MHVVSARHLGLPATSRDTFNLLAHHGVATPELTRALKAMAGFRNLCAPSGQEVDPSLLRQVLDHHLHDPHRFADVAGRFP